MPTSRALVLTLSAFLLAGCGDGDDAAPRDTATIDTIDGVETVRYGAEAATVLPWRLDTLAVLGDPFAADEYQFNQVNPAGLGGDGDGNLYVLDTQGGRVLSYTADGAHRATLGRPGEGPGELGQPMGLAMGPGDTIWVSDFSNSRLTGYPPDGGEPRTIALPENAGIPMPRMAARPDGFLMHFRPIFAFRRGGGGGMQMSRPGGDDEAEVQQLPLVRLDPSLQPLDTLWRTPEPPLDMVQIETGDRMFMSMMAREYWPEFLWDALSDGSVVLSEGAEYRLRFVDGDGRVLREVRRDPAPRTATEADRELARQRARDEAEDGVGVRIGGGGPDEEMQRRMLEQRLEKMTFADVIPRVLRLAVDPRDRVWVGVSEETAGEVERIDLYDPDGRLLGELRDFPFPDVFLGPDRLGVLRRDELDVQQVVVLGCEGCAASGTGL